MEAVRLSPTTSRNGKGAIAGPDATLVMSANASTRQQDLVLGIDMSSEYLQETLLEP